MDPSSRKHLGVGAICSIGKSTDGTLSELGKSIVLPRDGKKWPRKFQARIFWKENMQLWDF